VRLFAPLVVTVLCFLAVGTLFAHAEEPDLVDQLVARGAQEDGSTKPSPSDHLLVGELPPWAERGMLGPGYTFVVGSANEDEFGDAERNARRKVWLDMVVRLKELGYEGLPPTMRDWFRAEMTRVGNERIKPYFRYLAQQGTTLEGRPAEVLARFDGRNFFRDSVMPLLGGLQTRASGMGRALAATQRGQLGTWMNTLASHYSAEPALNAGSPSQHENTTPGGPPAWLTTVPEVPGYLYAVGAAPSGTAVEMVTRQASEAAAKRELAERLLLFLQRTKIITDKRGKRVRPSPSTLQSTLTTAIVVERWVDQAGLAGSAGTAYTLLRLSLEEVETVLRGKGANLRPAEESAPETGQEDSP